MKLLLIDDEPDILDLIIREFGRQSDIIMDVAVGGVEGVQKVDDNRYDAVILDYSLPDIDGLEVLRRIHDKCGSPVIIVTGKGNEEIAVEAIKQGAFDYITKSVGYIEKLPWIVNNVVNRYRLIGEKTRLEKRLAAQREYLQAIFNDMEESVVIIDREFNIIDANLAFLRNSGYTREDVTGSKCYTVSHGRTAPCEPPDNVCPVNEVFASGAASQALHLHTDRSGNMRYVEISASPIRCDGEVESVIEISKDITKRTALEKKLVNTNKELEKKMAELEKAHKIALHSERLASVGRLAAGIAHEINNPLTNASLNFEVLKNRIAGVIADGEALQKLEAVERNIDRASIIAKELLEFSSQRESEFMPLNINSIITGVLILMGHRFRGIVTSRDLSDIPPVNGDPVKLEQVFINILENAVEAMPNGGGISISTSQLENYVVAEISDNGSGIPEVLLPKVFDPFFTTKEVGAGTGLGLSICYGIITRHNGTIELSSEVGNGTRVTIKLPVIIR